MLLECTSILLQGLKLCRATLFLCSERFFLLDIHRQEIARKRISTLSSSVCSPIKIIKLQQHRSDRFYIYAALSVR